MSIISQLIGLGFLGGTLIEEYFPDANPVAVVNTYLIYYILIDILIRGVLQKFPAIQLQKYLGLNIRKAQIAQYLCFKSLISFFNIAPLFFILPFCFSVIFPELGVPGGIHWLIMMFLIIMINHFLSFYIDRQFKKSGYISLLILSVILLSLLFDFQNYFSLSVVFAPVFSFLHQYFLGLLGLLALMVLLAYACYKLLMANAYIELSSMNERKYSDTNFAVFRRFGGSLGRLMQLEAKLIWRNKRSRTYLWLSLAFILYPLFYISDDSFNSTAALLIMGLLLTGAFSLNYGQLLLSWNSGHFDFILAQNIRIRDYLEAKFVLLAMSNLILYILSLAYCFFFPRMFLVNTVMFLFNTGFTIFAYMFFSMSTAKKIDIGKGAVFNYEGFGAAHYLIILPLMFLPVIVYGIFRIFDLRLIGLLFVGLVGLVGILLWKYLLLRAEKKFYKNKYRISTNFKK
ncbi:MAG: hypothetical protein GY705_19745 [Bacteroidetes bacterium]|nr:hypothetical protein [Bacteroidota bacterium]